MLKLEYAFPNFNITWTVLIHLSLNSLTRSDEWHAPCGKRQQRGCWWTNHEAYDGGRSDHPQTEGAKETGNDIYPLPYNAAYYT